MKTYHPLTEKIVDILVSKVNNTTRHSFRIMVGYYLSKVASMMRCNIQTKDRGVIPVNTYVLNLMVSGSGKGHSTNILEREFVSHFKQEFLNSVFPKKAEEQIYNLATEKATSIINNGHSVISLAEEIAIQQEKFTKQFERLGELAFSFDSATTPAVKQMREKLLLAAAGSMNLELDEIGSNLNASTDVLNSYLELYDIGNIKQKLLKNTAENIRSEELPGSTPTNLLMFGTPTKLLDGATTEDEFKQLLETGYARRLLFGYSTSVSRPSYLTPEDRYQQMIDPSIASSVKDVQNIFSSFAKRPFNPILTISQENSIHLIKYQMQCEEASDKFKEHQTTHKAEMTHRYYKTLKLAGAYAFADGDAEVSREHLDYAIQVVEDSGEEFHNIMRKKGTYERLAVYLSSVDKEVTQHELLEELPFYKGSEMQRKDMMTLATSYGYKNNIIIRKRSQDNIDFFIGETLSETDLNKLTVSISKYQGTGYVADTPPFDSLYKLTTASGYQYTAHRFKDGKRNSDNVISGFNLAIFDCDGDISMEAVKILLEDYTFLISTTKRHTPDKHRFRLILPMSHVLNLTPTDYSEFMSNIFEWLPFPVDTAAKDIARKWSSHNGQYSYNQGDLLDATLFIPETKRSDETKSKISIKGVSNIERWFITNTSTGNRANHLYRYGMVLIDAGHQLGEIIEKLTNMNNSLDTPIPEAQFVNSTLKSISKQLQQRK